MPKTLAKNLKSYAKEEQKTADSTPGVTSPWLKNKFGIYVEEEMQKFQTPEYVSSKAGMLDRRPPSFMINSRGVGRGMRNTDTPTFPQAHSSSSKIKASHKSQKARNAQLSKISELEARLKQLEDDLTSKDHELSTLQKETAALVKDRDLATR